MMVGFNIKSMYTIAKKEFMDNIRNKWIIVLTILFVILIVIFSYVEGAAGADIFGGMEASALGLLAVSSILIPLIAIILGFSTISGEAESGSLYVVLSYPVRRIEVLLGKFLGLGFVIIVSIFIGFGFGGVMITLTTSGESWSGFIGFILLSIFLGWIFLSLSICVSSFCKRRITSIGGGIVLWFWGMIYGTVMIAILYGAGHTIEDFMTGNVPDWFFKSVIFSPPDLHQTSVMRAFGISSFEQFGFSVTIPDFLDLGILLMAQIIWFLVPLFLAYFFFKRRDI